ncbi:MAG TPA: bifunctional polysaccharide deacetylase/glycosyltransferase family 2 protein [Micromonosporaceae bacterium]|nr:bifunctional polysaccharide deacetylase/glycosyltransferase family 2 protein [Micromonosporaceae bacterium]
MPSHAARGEPRAHWILLLLGLAVLLAALCLHGYAESGGGGVGAPPAAPDPVAARIEGPVVRADGPTPQVRAMPERTIALTFDDGPDPVWTPRVLDVLRRHRVRATFFVVGARVNEHPELVRRMIDEGHEVGSHTFTHADLSVAPAWRRSLELTLTRNAVAGATGRSPVLYRPPYSATPDQLSAADVDALREAGAAGHLAVLADLDTGDWRRPGVDRIARAAIPDGGSAGAVVLMHDGGGDRAQTVAALERLIPELTRRGYRFTTVSAGVEAPGTVRDATGGDRVRGTALRYAQTAAAVVAAAMSVLLVVSLVLAMLRLAGQVALARQHVRRVRRGGGQIRVLEPVSVIVPAYNEAANIAATVRSLVESDYPRLEVIVVDDGSTDGTADLVERLNLPGVRVVRQPNAGKPAALNNGIRYARTDLLILVDGDTVFQPDTVLRLVQGFADPQVGAVSGNTKVANRRGLLGRWQHLEYVIGFNLDRRAYDVAGCMPTIPGAIGAFRRQVLADVGGVPADTLAEDSDLTMAVLRAGWLVVYEEAAIAWTEAPGSLRQLWRQRYRWCYGTLQAIWKHRHAVAERGPGGALGRRGLPYLAVFQFALPLAAPAVDILAVYGLIFLPWAELAIAWFGLLAVQAFTAWYALRLDRERPEPLWSLPFQQVVYRQLMYLVVVQSVVTALIGNRLRWHRITRTGQAAALVTPRPVVAQNWQD